MSIELIGGGEPQTDNLTVTNNKVTLTVLPAYCPVSIPSFVAVQTNPQEGQFAVDYTTGILTFNAADEGEAVAVTYITGGGAAGVTPEKVDEIITAVNALEGEDPESLLTTKGDLIGRNATVPIRIPVGTNGKVLTANSAVAAGLEWAAPSGSQIAGAQVFTASGDFTVPAGVTKIKARMWGGGGGGGGAGAGDGLANGAAGTVGANSWVLDAGKLARGGPAGNPGLANSTPGNLPAGLDPVFTALSFQAGILGVAVYQRGITSIQRQWDVIQNRFAVLGALHDTFTPGAPGGNGFANTGAAAAGGTGNTDGGSNTGGAGAAGLHGEYAEWTITVTPAQVVPVTVGAGGAGGLGGIGGGFNGGDGGVGGSGFVIIEW